jgi:hypothetical protein
MQIQRVVADNDGIRTILNQTVDVLDVESQQPLSVLASACIVLRVLNRIHRYISGGTVRALGSLQKPTALPPHQIGDKDDPSMKIQCVIWILVKFPKKVGPAAEKTSIRWRI